MISQTQNAKREKKSSLIALKTAQTRSDPLRPAPPSVPAQTYRPPSMSAHYIPASEMSLADLRGYQTTRFGGGYPAAAKALIAASKEATDENNERELLVAAYDIINPPPPPKVKRGRKTAEKAPKAPKPEKTEAELEAEQRDAQEQLMDALEVATEKYLRKMEHLKVERNGKTTYGKVYTDIFTLLSDDGAQSKRWRNIKRQMEGVLFAEWLEGQTAPKKGGRRKKSDSESDDEPREKLEARRDYTGQEGKNERTTTGETMVVNGFSRCEGKTVCKVITYFNHTDKHGVELPENQKVILNISSKDSGTAQVQPKPALRSTPIDKVVGCKCRTKPNFFTNVYERDDSDGSWTKVSPDWGWAPCNIKCVGDSDYCARHLGSKKVIDWEREMLLVAPQQIV